jgi:hypothetical protein
MGALIDFFAVRPVFTLYGLRVLWGAYLLSQVRCGRGRRSKRPILRRTTAAGIFWRGDAIYQHDQLSVFP